MKPNEPNLMPDGPETENLPRVPETKDMPEEPTEDIRTDGSAETDSPAPISDASDVPADTGGSGPAFPAAPEDAGPAVSAPLNEAADVPAVPEAEEPAVPENTGGFEPEVFSGELTGASEAAAPAAEIPEEAEQTPAAQPVFSGAPSAVESTLRPGTPYPGGSAAAFGSPSAPAVGCYGLTKLYGSMPALAELSVELPAGKIIGLLGPNGSGKTTLIKILAGLLTPTAGEARIYGEKPGTGTKAVVSYLPERMYFDPGMKVDECIRLFRDFYADFDENRARGMLTVLNVPMDRKLKTLSKGTKEKVQLVLVMARRAKLYLLDEPIGGVDPAARDFILSTIVAAHDPGATVILSTHLIHDVEPILDGFVFLDAGRCIMSGDADTVRRESGKTLDELFREVFRCY